MKSKVLQVRVPGEAERNAAMLVQTASGFDARIHIAFRNKTVNAKSIMGVMTLPLADGDEVEVRAEGTDEERAVECLEKFFAG